MARYETSCPSSGQKTVVTARSMATKQSLLRPDRLDVQCPCVLQKGSAPWVLFAVAHLSLGEPCLVVVQHPSAFQNDARHWMQSSVLPDGLLTQWPAGLDMQHLWHTGKKNDRHSGLSPKLIPCGHQLGGGGGVMETKLFTLKLCKLLFVIIWGGRRMSNPLFILSFVTPPPSSPSPSFFLWKKKKKKRMSLHTEDCCYWI